MKTYLVSYGSPQFNLCLLQLALKSRQYGADVLKLYTPACIRNTNFYQSYQHILCQLRGGGYWLWKPYIILQTMKEACDGDVIAYCDAGVDLLSPKSLELYLDGQDIFILKNWECHIFGCANSNWTKRDTFILMDSDSPRYWDSPQVTANFVIFRNGETMRQFVSEWFEFCKDERILTDMPNTQGKDDHSGFVYHRHDQSILSILAEKHQIDLAVDHEFILSHHKIDYRVARTVWLFLTNYREGMKILRQLYGAQPWRILQLWFRIMLLWWLPIGLYPASYIELGKRRKFAPKWVWRTRTQFRSFVLSVLEVLKLRKL